MLTHLTLKNFKCWEQAEIDFGSITAFFGANSSGKTSILQFLLLLKQTATIADPAIPLFLGDRESPVELGTFQDIIFNHETDRSLEWQLGWQSTHSNIGDITHQSVIRWQDSMVVEEMMYTTEKFKIRLKRVNDEYQLESKPALKRSPGRPPQLKSLIKCYGFPEQVRTYYKNTDFISEIELDFINLLKRIYYLGPLREYPQRQYVWAGAMPTDVGFRGERTIDALLASRESVGGTKQGSKKKTVETAVAKRLKEMGLIHDFSIRPVASGSRIYEVKVSRTAGSTKVALTDVGFGISQVLPVLTLCYYVPEGSILILEQPEIHLHPAVQSGLADVLIDAVKTRRLQIILESHSEHLLTRLQRRIAEEVIHTDQVRIYFCELRDDRAHLTPLQISLFGEIINWPEDFFGDRLGEMIAMHQKIVERKTNEK